MFYGRYDYPTGKFLWGNLRYQRVSEYNLQTFLNMKNSKLREEQIMSAKRDYYEVLGVSRDADKNTIKKAYRKLAKKYHPDTNQGNAQAAERFKEATEAYNVLSNPEKKKLYDQFGHAAFDGSMPEGGAYQYSGAGAGQNGGYQEFHFNGADMGDMFGDIFGDMFHGRSNGGGRSYSFHSDGNGGFHQYYSNGSGAGGFGQDGHFGGFGSSGGFGRGQFRQKGSDIHADVTVSFDDAAFGCEKMIHLQDGNGQRQSLKVNIPAGIDTGKTVRLKGKGNPGFNGGEAGDLLLKVTVGDRAGFERKGMDVYTNITIPFTTAVLGGEAVVPTLTGNVVCSIRPGTQSGSKIRLRGKGIVSMKDKNIHGDEYAVVQIQVPKNLNETAKEKLREFAKAC